MVLYQAGRQHLQLCAPNLCAGTEEEAGEGLRGVSSVSSLPHPGQAPTGVARWREWGLLNKTGATSHSQEEVVAR